MFSGLDPTLPRRSLLGLLGLLGVGGLTLGACGAPSTGGAAPATSTAPSGPATGSWTTPRDLPAGWGSGQEDGAFPRTVVHALGETTLDRAPTRIAVISTGQMDAVLTMGLVPVASTAGDGALAVPTYLRHAHPDAADALDDVADLGSRVEPNLEALAAVAPDLVLMNSATDGAASLWSTASAIAPTVVTRGTGLYWKQDLQLLADALGRRRHAQDWLAGHHERAAALGDGLAPRPSVSFLRKNGDRVRVFGVASFAGSVAEDAGLPRPPAQEFTDETSRDLSLEELHLADADRLFFAVQGGDESELTGLPLWPSLPVVAAGHEVEVDDDVFYLNAGPTAAALVLDALATGSA